MTTDEAKELIGNSSAHAVEVDFWKRLHQSQKMAVNALDDVEKYRKAIENIKSDIIEERASCGNFSDGIATAHGLELALDIIEKHLEGISSVASSKESDYTGKCGSCKYFAFRIEFDEKGKHRFCCNLKNGNHYQLAISESCDLYVRAEVKGDDTNEANISST